MKIIIAMIMAMLMCILPLSVSASAKGSRKKALPTSAGIQALRDEFESDVAPEAEP